MSQAVENIQPSYPLFRNDEYKANLKNKQDNYEERHPADKIQETFLWSTTKEYQDLNFAREALTVNPAKACQPLGAVLCSLGFKNTLPYVHGSQGCVAYFRTYFNRHFKEPISCVSDSMTEDAAVFGGQKNMFDGLENAKAMYKPDMIAVSTTCMAEVIGDDLNAFINNTKKEGHIPQEYPVPFAHTPSFVGSHTTGWDNMFEGIARYFTLNHMEGKEVGSNGKLNIVPGFETYLGNFRVIKRMMSDMGVDLTLLSDPTEVLDTPADGKFRMYSGGTTMEEVKDAPNAYDTLLLQPWQLEKTKKFVQNTWKHEVAKINIPMGLEWTDEFLMKVAEITGKAIPESLLLERGRYVDMLTDSHAWLHGKKFGLYGDADFVLGMTKFLLEVGAEPIHILCNHANKRWKKEVEKLLASSPYGANSEVHIGKDLWHFRSLMFTNKPDFMIGNSYGKFIQRDTLHKGKEFEVPLIRIGFPIFDRHHMHRDTTLGYEGAMYMLRTLTNAVLERLDEETRGMGTTDYNYDLVR
ncbi:MAG TPA: nitrogenase molybdenum-iron protein subunit beta [Candidatus Thiothrix moscowensis]|uniref:nitrogenase molybdenum-iron protein subunit beta n=1 Tax=unclassified Thiothrix TaxID=2636184 RepID=UPI0025E5D030|nr:MULTISPECIES: nitrogenase molybdenum-iron protein subunit beta [unclassified Thiothrix]HRJ53691.1 nitrogenase molybdenum-iron protein subunit beta [Candidatus Thiothrix moscowensis]HRJ93773.1 nitrogenase molybdenum-iron protein subunit beta [Candidatus Thiothrix moscowensis]